MEFVKKRKSAWSMCCIFECLFVINIKTPEPNRRRFFMGPAMDARRTGSYWPVKI